MRQLYWKVMSSVIVASSVIVSCGGDSKGTEPIIVDPSSSSGVVGSSSSAPPLSSAIMPSSSSGGGSSSSVAPSSSSSGGGSSSSVTPSSSSSGGGSSSSVAPSSSSSGGGSSSSVAPSSSSSGGGSSSSVTPSSSSWNPFKAGVSYGEFTDTRNGKVYKTVVLGSLNAEMFAQNLDIGTQVLGSTDQSNNGVIEKYCYNDDPTNCDKFGGLYQWSEAMGFPSDCNTNQTGSAGCASTITAAGTFGVQHQGLCPSGWHIMNETDWNQSWDGGSQSTSRLKANLVWSGSNMTGFSVLPGGARVPSATTWSNLGTYAYFWTPRELDSDDGYKESIYVNSTNLDNSPYTKTVGFSVRCVKDY